MGLATTSLPKEIFKDIRYEEDLEEVLQNLQQEHEQQQQETEAYESDQQNEDQVGHDFEATQQQKVQQKEPQRDNDDQAKQQIVDSLDNKISNIKRNRSTARENLEIQAKKMKVRLNLKYSKCKVGDNVRVSVPDVDRGREDFRNILMAIVEVSGDLYRLGNENGTIKEKFSRNQFTPCNANLVDVTKVSTEEKTLRELARNQSLLGGRGYSRCNCKGGCTSKKCKCKSKDILCNSKCRCLSCKNK